MRRFYKFFQLLILLSFFVVPVAGLAQAGGATLFVSPGSGTYTINKSFSMKVMVDSNGGVGINAAEGTIKYDPSYLSISKVTDTNSIFKLWTSDPSYSNSAGTITFGGGSPGSYTGSAGEIFSVTFTAKKAGVANVTWSAGVVLAADGKGTNVFNGFGNAKYTIQAAAEEEKREETKEETKEEPKGILPPLPEVSSVSHPQGDTWYSDNEPEFAWKILSDLTGVSFEITDKAIDDPGEENDGIIENIKLESQEDGEWHFHIKYQNRFGWGQIAHKKLLIDTTPPKDFIIVLDNDGDVTNPTPKLVFSTTDETSGISHYQLDIGLESARVSKEEMNKGYYKTQPLAPGDYEASVAAVDLAGNIASSTLKFSIDPLKAPIITSLPKIHNRKDDLIIRGTSFYPNVTVRLYIGSDNEEEETMTADISTDNEGNWTYFYKGKIDKGTYEVWARIFDERGAQSLDSTRHIMTVVSPSIIAAYCSWIMILLLLVIAGLILYIFYQRKEYREEKLRILTETEEVKSRLGKIFAALREEIDELIILADKKPGMSESERRVKEKLQESLDISEEFISKEVEDVEKEINVKKKEEK
ncbi:hypothetical protein KAR28_02310 [Candidatus Parcubacteria bacterium]|nr:hypothetical protein [Candidatus Parcubacteria bacterium]